MKHVSRFAILLLSLAIPLVYGGQALAAPKSITQELHVKAIVPDHRDVIINTRGEIAEITSNTLKDVSPSVYMGRVAPENKIELTDKLLEAYRKRVPEGTARYGVLYKNTGVVALLSLRATKDT